MGCRAVLAKAARCQYDTRKKRMSACFIDIVKSSCVGTKLERLIFPTALRRFRRKLEKNWLICRAIKYTKTGELTSYLVKNQKDLSACGRAVSSTMS